MKKIFTLFIILIPLSLSSCSSYLQDKLIFVPNKLPKNYVFQFDKPFEELNIKNSKGINLNGLHFYAQTKPKGAVLFLHGNADNISRWEEHSAFWTKLGYDFFIFDYQGFGKSGGKIRNEQALYDDIHLMYRNVLNYFEKDKIIIAGYSIGTGLAAETAQHFGIQKLILISPYFSFTQLAQQKIPFVSEKSLPYKIPTYKFLLSLMKKRPDADILIIHGKKDRIIHIQHSQQLDNLLKQKAKVWQLDCCGHKEIIKHKNFYQILTEYLR